MDENKKEMGKGKGKGHYGNIHAREGEEGEANGFF